MPLAHPRMRHHALDLVRGIAAVGVVVYHWTAQNTGQDVASLGTFSVYLFFVLSALTMAMVYEPDFSDGLDKEKVTRFFRNRFARLAPLLMLVAAINVVLWGNWERGILTGSGLFGFGLPGFVSNAMGAWSLGIELLFYALLPAILLLKLPLRILVLVTTALIGAQMLYLGAIRDLEPHWHYYTVFLTFLPYFAMGLLTWRLGGVPSRLFAVPMLLGMAALACFSLVWEADLFRDRPLHLALMLITGATVYCAHRTKLPTVMERVAGFLGNCSYALYLTHPLTALVFARFGIVPYVSASLLVAYLTYQYFEKPCRSAIRPKPSHRKPAGA